MIKHLAYFYAGIFRMFFILNQLLTLNSRDRLYARSNVTLFPGRACLQVQVLGEFG